VTRSIVRTPQMTTDAAAIAKQIEAARLSA
jgi:hypothetical protein